MLELKNHEDIVEQLTAMLMQFDKAANQYQTDVYLYYDKETQTATLDTYVNVGGNSWLDDDHYVLHRDKEHYDDGVWNWYQSVSEIVDYLGVSEQTLKAAVVRHLDLDEDEIEDYELDLLDLISYVKTNEAYTDKLEMAYFDAIEEQRSVYYDSASEIVDSFVRDFDCDD